MRIVSAGLRTHSAFERRIPVAAGLQDLEPASIGPAELNLYI